MSGKNLQHRNFSRGRKRVEKIAVLYPMFTSENACLEKYLCEKKHIMNSIVASKNLSTCGFSRGQKSVIAVLKPIIASEKIIIEIFPRHSDD